VPKISSIIESAQEMAPDQFSARHPHPVLIVEEVMGGEIQRPSAGAVAQLGRRLQRRRRDPQRVVGSTTFSYIPKPRSADPFEDQRQDPPGAGRFVGIRRRPGASHPGDAIVVGRNHACDVLVNDYTVSSRHVSIRVHREASAITDLDSTNGTWVGGRRIEPLVRTILRDGHLVRLGRIRCRFLNPSTFHRYLGRPRIRAFQNGL